MRTILTLLVVATVSVSFPAAADGPSAPSDVDAVTTVNNTPTVHPKTAQGLATVHGDLTGQSAAVAGRARNVELTAPVATTKVVRPPPTPRALRKMGTERAIASVDANVRACARENTAIAPVSFGLRVSVGPGGEVEGAEVVSPPPVAPALRECVVKAVSAARFGPPGPTGASVVVPVTVPGRSAAMPIAAAAPADTTTVTVTPPAAVAQTPPAPAAPDAPSEAPKDVVATKQ
jgi:hypothetical protein